MAKHAPGARADVTVSWSSHGVVVEVRDNGHGTALFGPDQRADPPGTGTARDARAGRIVRRRLRGGPTARGRVRRTCPPAVRRPRTRAAAPAPPNRCRRHDPRRGRGRRVPSPRGTRVAGRHAEDLTVVGEAANGKEALDVVADCFPTSSSWTSGCPRWMAWRPPAAWRQTPRPRPRRVLVLTTFDLDEYVFEALRVGASGFLLKAAMPDELRAAIRVVAGGEALLAPSATRRLIEEFTRARQRRPVPGSPSPRSPGASGTCWPRSRGACRTPRSPPSCT